MRDIAALHGKRMLMLPCCGWGLTLLSKCTGLVNKAFGNLTYDQEISTYPKGNYRLTSLEDSLKLTETD